MQCEHRMVNFMENKIPAALIDINNRFQFSENWMRHWISSNWSYDLVLIKVQSHNGSSYRRFVFAKIFISIQRFHFSCFILLVSECVKATVMISLRCWITIDILIWYSHSCASHDILSEKKQKKINGTKSNVSCLNSVFTIRSNGNWLRAKW